MTEELALFPLGTVLFPGLMLPLNVFEQRYRTLIQELTGAPEGQPRRFGVVCIVSGAETAGHGQPVLADVGCSAELTSVSAQPDGRFEIVTVGGRRFRLGELDASRPYLRSGVTWLGEPAGDGAAAAAGAVAEEFRRYLTLLAELRGARLEVPDLPGDPLLLGYLVAATAPLDLAARQRLLAAPDAAERLRAELGLLRRENALMRTLPSTPAPDLTRGPLSAN